jgi:hypothetical protein
MVARELKRQGWDPPELTRPREGGKHKVNLTG